MRKASGRVIAVLGAVALAVSIAGCSGFEPASDPGRKLDVVRVPADASLQEAGSLVAPGGLILIDNGTYKESLEVHADDVTVRGADRNGVILDGELTRQNGVVGTGKRFTVENLTVRDFLQNGVLISGVTDEDGAGIARGPDGYIPSDVPPPVPGYLVRFVTAQNNGLYGIYAFNRTEGVIRDNLASGGSDSGIYIGQCVECNALVEGNVVTSNAVGMEFANASKVVVTGNRIVQNRIGISVLSNYLEAHGPSSSVHIVGNLIADNNNPQTPVQASGAFGIGVGLGGTADAEVRANTITGNGSVGVWVNSSEDFAPEGNRVTGNAWGGNALDAAFTLSATAEASGNCFELGAGATADPAALVTDGCVDPLPAGSFRQPSAPPGVMFSQVPFPDERPGLPKVGTKRSPLPDRVTLPDVSAVSVPRSDLLAGTAG